MVGLYEILFCYANDYATSMGTPLSTNRNDTWDTWFWTFFFLVDFLGVENYPVRIHPQPVEWVVENP